MPCSPSTCTQNRVFAIIADADAEVALRHWPQLVAISAKVCKDGCARLGRARLRTSMAQDAAALLRVLHVELPLATASLHDDPAAELNFLHACFCSLPYVCLRCHCLVRPSQRRLSRTCRAVRSHALAETYPEQHER